MQATSDHIAKIFILNDEGQVAFSSNQAEIGKQLSRTDESCRVCHSTPGLPPSNATAIFGSRGVEVQRNITVLYNDPECYGCHAPQQRVNGKLIIDRSLTSTYALIGAVRYVILASAALCLIIILLVVPYLSRSFDRYISKVVSTSNEISMIYTIIESVSKSIDMEDLKTITLDIMADAFDSEEVTLVLPLRDGQYRIVSRIRGEGEQRSLPESGSMLAAAIGRWQAGEFQGKEVSADRTTAYLPIASGGIPLTLLEIRSAQTPFSEEKLHLIDSIVNPLAIAFENARLYTIAITDELTGLYTVRHLRTCLDRQRDLFERHGEKFALLMIDIDNFKAVNDTYGHPVGDSVLKRVSACIAEAVRKGDMAFRYGGEEFAVLLPMAGQAEGFLVAERIRSMVAEAVHDAEGAAIRSTVSIGLALFPENAATVRDLILVADKALYAAKQAGKNRVETAS